MGMGNVLNEEKKQQVLAQRWGLVPKDEWVGAGGSSVLETLHPKDSVSVIAPGGQAVSASGAGSRILPESLGAPKNDQREES
jgi:hypothetical protein